MKAVSKEAQDVLGGIQLQEPAKTEKVNAPAAKTEQNNPIVKGNGDENQPPAKQQKVEPLVIGAKKVETPAKEVVIPAKETEKRPIEQIAPEDLETWFESQVNERFKGDSKTLSEKLSKVTQYEEQLAADPYKNSFTKQLDELLAKNIPVETAIKYLTTDAAKLSPRELVAFKLQQDNPELTSEQIERKIDRTYKLGKYAPTTEVDGKDVPDETDGLDDLMIDASPIKKEFESLKAKQLESGKSRVDVVNAQKEVQRVTQWLPAVEEVLESFDKIVVDVPGKRPLQFTVEMEPAEKKQYVEMAAQWVKSSGQAVTPETQAQLKQIIQKLYVAENFGKMSMAFAEQARSMNDEQWMQEVNNPSISNTAGKGDFGKSNKGSGDAIFDTINGIESKKTGRTR